MGEHTKEPWIWDEPSNWHGMAARVCTKQYEPIAQVMLPGWGHRRGTANAARIVACVNACAGIPTADLAQPVYPAAVVQRLVEAAARLRSVSDNCTEEEYKDCWPDEPTPWDQLDAALAEVGRVGKNTQETQQ